MSEPGTPERPQPASPSVVSTPNRGVALIEKRTWKACPEALWDPSALPDRAVNRFGEVYQPRLHLLQLVTLVAMLATPYPDDRHFVLYVVADREGKPLQRFPRLRKEHLGLVRQRGFDVLLGARAADIDTLVDHAPITPEQIEQIRTALARYPAVLYFTRGGARLVQPLKEILSPEQYEASVYRWLMELRALLPGFKIDFACKDWTRLFRCPRVIRADTSYHDTLIEGTYEFVAAGNTTPVAQASQRRVFDVLATDTADGLKRCKRFALGLVDAKSGTGYMLLRKYATVLGRDAAGGIITPDTAISVLENAILDWDVEHAVYERAIADCFEFGLSRGPWPEAKLVVDQAARARRLLDVLGRAKL